MYYTLVYIGHFILLDNSLLSVGSLSSVGSTSLYLIFLFFFFWLVSYYMGSELVSSDSLGDDSVLKHLWHHQDAILCCSLKVQIQFLYHGVSSPIEL